MVQYIWFVMLNACMVSIYSADRDENKIIPRSKVPSLQYFAQKAIAKKIMDEQDSIIDQLGRLTRFDPVSSFPQAIEQVKHVDLQMKTLLPTFLVKGSNTNLFTIPDIVQANEKLSQAFDATWSHFIRRNQRLCTLLNDVVSQASNGLNEYTFDTVHDALQSLPSWALTDIVSRFHLVTEYMCTEKESAKRVVDVSALHICENHLFVSGCLSDAFSKKVESISLINGQSRILQGNDFCVHQFLSRGDFLFGIAPYKIHMYDNAHLYIWNFKTKDQRQVVPFSGKIVGAGLNGSYCFVVDSFGVVHCLSFNKEEKKFETISKFPFKRPVHTYQMLGDRYAYNTDNEKVVFGRIDCSGIKPINNEMGILNCPASRLFFLSDTELLAGQHDRLLYISVDDERQLFVSVPQKLRVGHVQHGMVLHGKLIYPSDDNRSLYVYDPRLQVYEESVSDYHGVDRFCIGLNALVAYDAQLKFVWHKEGCSDLKALLAALLIQKDTAHFELLLEHSKIIKKEWRDWREKRVSTPSYVLCLLRRYENEKQRRAEFLSSPSSSSSSSSSTAADSK